LNSFTGSVTSFIYNGTLSSFLVYSTSQPISHTSSTPLLIIPYHTISTMSPSTRRPRPQGRVKKHKARSNSPRAFETLPVEVRSSIVFSAPGFHMLILYTRYDSQSRVISTTNPSYPIDSPAHRQSTPWMKMKDPSGAVVSLIPSILLSAFPLANAQSSTSGSRSNTNAAEVSNIKGSASKLETVRTNWHAYR